jgi:protein-tyrosine-phosphatase
MGEGLLRHALAAEAEPLRSLKVISAGVAARASDAVSENSVVALRKVGIDISSHLSQLVTQEALNDAILVLCMTETPPKELRLFREFMPIAAEKEVPDPFGGPLKLYEMCRDELVEAIPSIIAHLKTLVPQKS